MCLFQIKTIDERLRKYKLWKEFDFVAKYRSYYTSFFWLSNWERSCLVWVCDVSIEGPEFDPQLLQHFFLQYNESVIEQRLVSPSSCKRLTYRNTQIVDLHSGDNGTFWLSASSLDGLSNRPIAFWAWRDSCTPCHSCEPPIGKKILCMIGSECHQASTKMKACEIY